MAIVIEKYASRENTTGRNASAQFMYLIGQSDSETDILALLLRELPDPYLGLVLTSTAQHPIGNGWWNCEAHYGLLQKRDKPDSQQGSSDGDPLTPDVKINITSQQQHITQALYTASRDVRGSDTRLAPDYNGAIGVSRAAGSQQGSVEGCDFPMPLLEWTETWTFLAQYITKLTIRNWANLVGRTNKATFRTFTHGEVMFMGVTSEGMGSPGLGMALRKCVFSFKRQPTTTTNILDFPTRTKYGWDYLWLDYESAVGASYIAMVPRAMYIERIGRPGLTGDDGHPTNEDDFTGILGIGS